MSHKLITVPEDNTNPKVLNSSFSGGKDRGQCLQMFQIKDGMPQSVHLTKKQVAAQIAIMAHWLSERS